MAVIGDQEIGGSNPVESATFSRGECQIMKYFLWSFSSFC